MEVLGAAGSIVGIAGFGLQLSQVLVKFTADVRSAPDAVRAVLEGVDATTGAMNQVHTLLDEETRNIDRERRSLLFSAQGLQQLRTTADKCLIIFWKIEAIITNRSTKKLDEKLQQRLLLFRRDIRTTKQSTIPKPNADLVLSTWDRLRWPYVIPKLEEFGRQLGDLKSDLVLMFQVVNIRAVSIRSKSHVQDVKLLTESYTEALKTLFQADKTSDRVRKDDYYLDTDRDRVYPHEYRYQHSQNNPRLKARRRPYRPMASKYHDFDGEEEFDDLDNVYRGRIGHATVNGRRSFPRRRAGAPTDRSQNRIYFPDSDETEIIELPSRSRNKAPEYSEDTEESDDEKWLAQKRAEMISDERLARAKAAIEKNSVPVVKVPEAPVVTENTRNRASQSKGKDKKKGTLAQVDLESKNLEPVVDVLESEPKDTKVKFHGPKRSVESVNALGTNNEEKIILHSHGNNSRNGQSQPAMTRASQELAQLDGPVADTGNNPSFNDNLTVINPDTFQEPNGFSKAREIGVRFSDGLPYTQAHMTEDTIDISQEDNQSLNGDINSGPFINLTLSPDNLMARSLIASDFGDGRDDPVINNGRLSTMSTYHGQLDFSQHPSPESKIKLREIIWSQMKSRLLKRAENTGRQEGPAFREYNSGDEEDTAIVFTGYFIKGRDFFPVPNAQMQTLKKSESEWFKFQPKELSWWNTLAFLKPDELETVQKLLDPDTSLVGKQSRNLVLLKRLKKGKFKFWTITQEILLAIVSDNHSILDSARYPYFEADSKPVNSNTILEVDMRQDTDINGLEIANKADDISNNLGGKENMQALGTMMISQLNLVENLSERQSRNNLTTYSVYTISPIGTEHPTGTEDTNKEEDWMRCQIVLEAFTADIVKTRIEFLGKTDTSIIRKKACLSVNQQLQIDRIFKIILSSERDPKFEWVLCQLEARTEKAETGKPSTLKQIFRQKARTKSGFDTVSITVYFQRTPKAEVSCVELLRNIQSQKAQHLKAPESSRKIPTVEDKTTSIEIPVPAISETDTLENMRAELSELGKQIAQDRIDSMQEATAAESPFATSQQHASRSSYSPQSNINTSLNPGNGEYQSWYPTQWPYNPSSQYPVYTQSYSTPYTHDSFGSSAQNPYVPTTSSPPDGYWAQTSRPSAFAPQHYQFPSYSANPYSHINPYGFSAPSVYDPQRERYTTVPLTKAYSNEGEYRRPRDQAQFAPKPANSTSGENPSADYFAESANRRDTSSRVNFDGSYQSPTMRRQVASIRRPGEIPLNAPSASRYMDSSTGASHRLNVESKNNNRYGELNYPPSQPSDGAHRQMLRQQLEKYQKESERSRDRRVRTPYPEHYDSRPFDPRNMDAEKHLLEELLLKWTPAEQDGTRSEVSDHNKSEVKNAAPAFVEDADSSFDSAALSQTHPNRKFRSARPTVQSTSTRAYSSSEDEFQSVKINNKIDRDETSTKGKGGSRVTFSNYAEPTVEDAFTENEYGAPRGVKRRGKSPQSRKIQDDNLDWGSISTSRREKKKTKFPEKATNWQSEENKSTSETRFTRSADYPAILDILEESDHSSEHSLYVPEPNPGYYAPDRVMAREAEFQSTAEKAEKALPKESGSQTQNEPLNQEKHSDLGQKSVEKQEKEMGNEKTADSPLVLTFDDVELSDNKFGSWGSGWNFGSSKTNGWDFSTTKKSNAEDRNDPWSSSTKDDKNDEANDRAFILFDSTLGSEGKKNDETGIGKSEKPVPDDDWNWGFSSAHKKKKKKSKKEEPKDLPVTETLESGTVDVLAGERSNEPVAEDEWLPSTLKKSKATVEDVQSLKTKGTQQHGETAQIAKDSAPIESNSQKEDENQENDTISATGLEEANKGVQQDLPDVDYYSGTESKPPIVLEGKDKEKPRKKNIMDLIAEMNFDDHE